MAAFHYVSVNAKGEKKKGIIEADNIKHARQLLREKSLTPLEVTPAQQKTQKSSAGRVTRTQSMNSKELALMTRQLATLLNAGLPVEEVLAAVAEQTERPRTKGLILSVAASSMALRMGMFVMSADEIDMASRTDTPADDNMANVREKRAVLTVLIALPMIGMRKTKP